MSNGDNSLIIYHNRRAIYDQTFENTICLEDKLANILQSLNNYNFIIRDFEGILILILLLAQIYILATKA